MDYQKPTSLGITHKGTIFQRKPNLQQVEHMLVEERFGQTPSAIPKPDCDPKTHTHTHTYTHTHTHTHTHMHPHTHTYTHVLKPNVNVA